MIVICKRCCDTGKIVGHAYIYEVCECKKKLDEKIEELLKPDEKETKKRVRRKKDE